MDLHGFITTIERLGGISNDEEAERVACVTLQALSRRISVGEARDIAARLPDPLRPCVRPEDPPEKFHVDEFLRRIAEPLGVDRQVAERDASAVLAALFKTVGPDEFADMRSELPKDFGPLLDAAIAKAPSVGTDGATTTSEAAISYDEFLAQLEDQTHPPREAARRAAEAVLETLAYRIDDRTLDKIERRLPAELWPVLERGRMRSGGKAVPLELEEFVRQTQRLEGPEFTRDEVLRHARAVMQTLRKAVGGSLFGEMMRHLTDDYLLLVPAGPSGPDEEEAREPRGPDELADLSAELPNVSPSVDRAMAGGGAQPTSDATPDMSYEQFLSAVAARGAGDEDHARKATEAVLEVLAMRITGGQLDDLEPLLPIQLWPALERGRARSGGRAHPLTLEEFLREVQRLEGVTRDIAFRHARAVMLTFREAVGEKEFHDTLAQLPLEYRQLLRRK